MVYDKELVKEQLPEMMRRIVGLAVILIILGIIKAVIVKLPGMYEPVFDFITIADIADAIIWVAIIVVILLFGQDISKRTGRMFPSFTEITPLINNIAILIAIFIAYNAFDTIITPFLYKIDIVWLYPVVLLCIAIFPIYHIIASLFTGSGKITELMIKKQISEAKTVTITCPNCKSKVVQAKFCSNCGHELPAKEIDTKNICPKCGAELKPGAKFCTKCGTKIKMKSE